MSAKDSENQQLKAQIEELKDKTQEMMTDLQKQLFKKQEEEIVRKQQEASAKIHEEVKTAKSLQSAQEGPQSGFFDFVSTGNSGNTLFNTAAPSLFSEEHSDIENGETKVIQSVKESGDLNGGQKPDVKSGANFNTVENSDQGSGAGGSLKTPLPGVLPTNTQNNVVTNTQTNTQASASFVSAVGSYGSGVRAQVFEVIVRQALAGTQWREICAVPMQSNNISPQEVEAEVKRRQALLKK